MADIGTPPRREPAFNIPAVVVVCCLLLLGIHGIRMALSAETDNGLVALFAFLPARFSYVLHVAPGALAHAYQDTVSRNPILAAQIDFLMGDGQMRPWTALTYAFLHASWAHVGFNCIWLVAFGSAVARRLSALRFVLLLLLSAVIGALFQYAVDVTSFQLVIGASAGVSGAIGAAARFVFRPAHEQRLTLDRRAPQAFFRQPALTLRQTATTTGALLFIIFWFASNLLFGLYPSLSGISDAPVAWQAHIGGFLTGLLLFPLFDGPQATLPAVSTIEESEPFDVPPR